MKKLNLNFSLSVPGFFEAIAQAHPRGALMIASLVLLIFGQMTIAVAHKEVHWVANAFSFAALLFFLLGFAQNRLPERIREILLAPGRFFHISPAQSIYLLFSILYVILASGTNHFNALQPQPAPTVVMWLVAVFFMLFGAWQPGGTRLPTKKTLLVAAALGLIALLVRIISATTIPSVLTGDEASMGVSARAFIEGYVNNIFSVGWYSFPSFFYFLESLVIRVFGSTTFSLRLVSATAGALTVSFIFLLGRALFDRLTGWLAAIFLIGMHFHIHFSRLGLNNIWDGLSIVIVLGALWYGWQHHQRSYFLLAGVWLGLAQYFYVSSKVVIVLIPLWAGIAFFFDRERLRRHLNDIVLLFIAALVVVAPLAWFFINNPGEFLAPINRVSLSPNWISATANDQGIMEWQVLAKQVWVGLQGFTHANLRAWYEPGTPILRPVPAALFLLGLVLLLLKPRDMRTWLIFLLLLGFGMVSGLSYDPPAAQRYVAAAPWLALMIGYALAQTTERLKSLWSEFAPALAGVALLLAALLSINDARFYFYEFTPTTTQHTGNNDVAQRLADYLREHPDIRKVYFHGQPRMGYYSIQSIHFLVPNVIGEDIIAPWGSEENPVVSTPYPVFVLLPDKAEDLDAIRHEYPGGSLHEEKTSNGDLVFWVYDTSP